MIFIIDFEGTLLNTKRMISDLSINIINSLSKRHKLCIATFESFDNLKRIITQANVDCDYYSLEDNKGHLNGKDYIKKISNDIIQKIIKDYNNFIYTIYSNDGFIYNYQERLKPLYPINYQTDIIPLSSLTISLYNEAFNPFIAFLENNGLRYNVLAKDVKKALIKVSTGLVNKADILKHYKALFPNEKTASITDSVADVDLYSLSDYKIAMINGDEEIKKQASIITEFDNDHDGCMLELNNIAKL